ncbi:DUF300-domain-containing protein [Pluteus cervinus]|uniref:DUF300-domain-containing protein n=1 Tax=Pluteus cervinus TaxID=181527 RepID=A0ACD3ASA7_9AGAR|nr:DUF300-domain-containing protein [Pluteus cervinus]
MDGGSDYTGGAGSRLPTLVLSIAGFSTFVAVLVSMISIWLQLKNYRKPLLQRMVVRIMIMVPLYAVASLISLFSMEAAFVIDAIRDVYEAFVIYCFFTLLLSYLGGERSLLILMLGRSPKEPPFPINIFKRELDVSDPYTFLFLKRGILQYVQVKPVLAIVTLILKSLGKYNEGDFRANSGYLYVSIIYNVSICTSLYCLAMFWICVNDDLKPFRPVPKFLCVKGILFFSFWQSVIISTLVATGIITRFGPYTDAEHISVGLNDTLICLEMPMFAIAHNYAFSYTDFLDSHLAYVARMPWYLAFRDAFGSKDVIEDSKATLRGEGMDYREFEPTEGFMHQGAARDTRIRAGLRYTAGGKGKYWLPKAADEHGRVHRGVNRVIDTIAGHDQSESVRAPLLASQADSVVHLAPDLRGSSNDPSIWDRDTFEDGYELPFGDLDDEDEELFDHSKKYLFGDYNYPVIDVSSETARIVMWDEEERILSNERGAWFSPLRGAKGQAALEQRGGPVWRGYGAVSSTTVQTKRDEDGVHQQTTDGKVIDHDQSRVSRPNQSDMTLKWTKTSRQSVSPGHTTSSGSQSPPVSSSPSQHRQLSPGSRPDAVDLRVEDKRLQKQSSDRRKGDPAPTGSGVRKFGKPGSAARGVQVAGVAGGSRSSAVERSSAAEVLTEVLTVREEVVVARTESPPPHARVDVPKHYGIPSDDNPWA